MEGLELKLTETARRAGPPAVLHNRVSSASLAEARRVLHAGLRRRREEIEQALLARVNAIADSTDADPAYREGLRDSVAIALDYGLQTIESGEERAPPPPPALRTQARVAARSGIGLETVLRRYFAGYAVLGEFIAAEAERGGLPHGVLAPQLLRGRSALFDRLIAVVSEEYGREAASRVDSVERRRAERVERLLAGEQLDTSGLPYDFEAQHTAVTARGEGAAEAIRELASTLDRRRLVIRRERQTAWGWLGGRRGLDPAEAIACLRSERYGTTAFAFGEPAEGLAGWRLSHRQATAALPVALRGEGPCVRYADVALLATALQDDLFCASLRRLYLAPLRREGGASLLPTLRAYFEAGRNASSAACSLGVNRHTIADRLRAAEHAIGLPLERCSSELETALRLERLERRAAPSQLG